MQDSSTSRTKLPGRSRAAARRLSRGLAVLLCMVIAGSALFHLGSSHHAWAQGPESAATLETGVQPGAPAETGQTQSKACTMVSGCSLYIAVISMPSAPLRKPNANCPSLSSASPGKHHSPDTPSPKLLLPS